MFRSRPRQILWGPSLESNSAEANGRRSPLSPALRPSSAQGGVVGVRYALRSKNQKHRARSTIDAQSVSLKARMVRPSPLALGRMKIKLRCFSLWNQRVSENFFHCPSLFDSINTPKGSSGLPLGDGTSAGCPEATRKVWLSFDPGT